MSNTREQRLAGIRERFEKFILESVEWQRFRRDMLKNVAGSIDNTGKSASEITRAIAPWAAAFADSERERVLLEATKAQCSECAEGTPLKRDYVTFRHANDKPCWANKIHEMRSKGESR